MLVVTDNLTLKTSFDETLVWLTDLNSGQPVSGATISIYNEGFGEVGNASTDGDGVAEIAIPHEESLWDVIYAIVEDGDHFAVAMSTWDDGVMPYEFGLSTAFDFQGASLYMYTDRPIYRPGQEVFYKGVLRGKNDVSYSLPSGASVRLTVYNDQGDEIISEQVSSNEMGTFEGVIPLDDEAGLGWYFIEVEAMGISSGQGFQVAEFRKPEFLVDISAERESFIAGDTIEVTVDAEFFFGGPVSDADVEWTVFASPYQFEYEGPGLYSFANFVEVEGLQPDFIPDLGGIIADGAGTTDANGAFVIEIPANLDDANTSRLLTVEAVVTDVNAQLVAGRTGLIVHKGQYYAGVQPEQYIARTGDEAGFEIIVVDLDSVPVANTEVEVEFVERRWSSVREEDEFGRTQWVWEVEEILIGAAQTIETDEDGLARASFVPPSGGVYRVRVTATDPDGNAQTSSTFVWAAGSDFIPWRQVNNDRIDLVADRTTYAPGDTAEILIASPFQGEVEALVSIERGSVIRYEVMTLTNNSTVLEVPITGELAPNVYVSVVIVKGVDDTNPVPSFRMGLVELEVEPVEQTLLVMLTPDRDVVGPGEEVTYTIETTNFSGDAVDAEVSLALVDLATLSLAQPNSGPIVEHFYGNAGLGVRTSVPLIYLVDRRNQDLFDQGKGGGGGGGEGFFELRSEFKDTAHWEAIIRTGEDGEATVTITLPHNLTTWRMDARAVTAETLVGQAEVDIQATRPLLIRPVTPRFFVVQDEVALAAVVNNNTDEAIDAEVTLQAAGVTIIGAETHEISIPAGGRLEVQWPVVVKADARYVDLVFSVSGGGLQDASKPPLGDPDNEQQLPSISMRCQKQSAQQVNCWTQENVLRELYCLLLTR